MSANTPCMAELQQQVHLALVSSFIVQTVDHSTTQFGHIIVGQRVLRADGNGDISAAIAKKMEARNAIFKASQEQAELRRSFHILRAARAAPRAPPDGKTSRSVVWGSRTPAPHCWDAPEEKLHVGSCGAGFEPATRGVSARCSPD